MKLTMFQVVKIHDCGALLQAEMRPPLFRKMLRPIAFDFGMASSYSPPRLRQIPSTGDLLCVWNQVSRDEIKRGYRRGRLSAAISRDSGASWERFKTIEVSEGMEDVERVAPQEPITPVVGLPDVGMLPEGFATFDYPNVWFTGDKVYLTYHRSWVEVDEDAGEAVTLGERKGKARKPREMVLRIYPLAEFYR